jgi:hypothetical protein
MKADAGGRELFSGIHFGMDDWGFVVFQSDLPERKIFS